MNKGLIRNKILIGVLCLLALNGCNRFHKARLLESFSYYADECAKRDITHHATYYADGDNPGQSTIWDREFRCRIERVCVGKSEVENEKCRQAARSYWGLDERRESYQSNKKSDDEWDSTCANNSDAKRCHPKWHSQENYKTNQLLSQNLPEYQIQLKPITKSKNKSKLIALKIWLRGSFDEGSANKNSASCKFKCENELMSEFSFFLNKIYPMGENYPDESDFMKRDSSRLVQTTKARYQIKKEDIYLVRDKKKIPAKITITGNFNKDSDVDVVESRTVQYSNNTYATYAELVTFPIPCLDAASKPTKLVIARVYKDGNVIAKDIEFEFVLVKRDAAEYRNYDKIDYKFWLE